MRTMLLLIVLASVVNAQMNVVVVLADDLGHTDLGCQGSHYFETPHLDGLAKDGVRFTVAYSACTVCSPTRAALLTGQYPARLHITDWIAGHKRPDAKLLPPDWTMHLPTQTYTLAEAFKAAGYATASVGKWHLGGEAYYPEKHGFDINIGGTEQGQPPTYFSPFKIPTLKDGPVGEFLSDTLTREACSWIESVRQKPFFLYLPHFAVHTPLAGKAGVIAKYKAKATRLGESRNPTYAALVESVDDSIGTLRAKLKELKLDEKTIIIFTSDNGGLIGGKNPITTNPPFRDGKGSAYEGGVRVPFIVYWPGRTDFDPAAPVMTIDIMPTLVQGLKLPTPGGHTFDGAPLGTRNRSLYWHYPHYHPGGATPYSAVRKDGKRLIEFHEDGKLELYDLDADAGETRDLSARQPMLVKQLHDEMKQWRASVLAQMPVANPRFGK